MNRHIIQWVLVAVLVLNSRAACAAASLADIEWQRVFDTVIDREYRASAFGGGAGYSAPHFADTDGDGDLDMTLGNLQGTVIYYENGGSGSVPVWKAPDFQFGGIQTPGLSYPLWVDVDEDSDVDLVLGDASGAITYYENTGTQRTPVLAAGRPLQAGISTTRNARPALVDIDGDSLLDLYLFDVDSEGGGFDFYTLVHYEDTLPGPAFNFVLVERDVAGIAPIHPQFFPAFADAPNVPAPAISFADVNADGLQDMLVGKIDGFAALHLNTGSAGAPVFTLEEDEYNFFTVLGDATPVMVDVDVDGDLDLFVGAFDGAITAFFNRGTPEVADLDTVENFYGNTDMGGPVSPVIIDMDQDGDSDMLVGHHFGFLLHWLNEGTGGSTHWKNTRALHVDFLSTWYADLDSVASQIQKLDIKPVSCDYDGDGDFDLVVTDLSGDKYFLRNVGSRVIQLWERGPEPFPELDYDENIRISCGDLNGDGLFDVVVGREDGTLDRSLNTGTLQSGVWNQVVGTYAGVAVNSHAAPLLVDMDHDGDLDLVIGAGDGTLTVVENIGSASQPVWATPLANYADIDVGDLSQPAMMDIDGDSDLDFIIGQALGGLLVFQNQSPVLNLSPFIRTVIEGTAVTFSSQPEALEWSVPENRTGGSIDAASGVYQPGAPKPGEFDYRFVADVPIQDGGTGSGIVRLQKTLRGNSLIEHLEAVIEINHPDRTQMLLTLESENSGTRVVLFDGAQAAPGANISLLVSDDGPNPPVSGRMADFNGERALGRFLFYVEDQVPGVKGQLLNVGLQVNSGVPAVDVIEAGSADGRTGRAYLNVVGQADAAQSGKAIVIAGGRNEGDPVWHATNFMAQKAYRTLLLKGYAKTNIYYLSLVEDFDVDGNGLQDDIDGPADFFHATTAFEDFAANASSLFVYLADHGSDTVDETFFRLNSGVGETISATQLSLWVGSLQTNFGMDVTTVMDFCYAGKFLPPLAAASTGEHRIIASCGPDELAYFIAGGVVSFSSIFFNALLQNLDVDAAFRLAQGGMGAYQHALLDDTGDGLFSPDSDGSASSEVQLGGDTGVGQDVPNFSSYTPNMELEGDVPVTLYAGEIYSPHLIKRVTAVIIPPNHTPDLASGNPVVDLVELELIWNPARHRYEATHSGFKVSGVYTVIHVAEDAFGGISFPKQSFLTQSGVEERSIVVIGEMDDATEQAKADALASLVYSTLGARLLPKDAISLTHPHGVLDADQDGTNDVNGVSSPVGINQAIGVWAAGADILNIYLVGQSTNGSFVLAGGTVVDAATVDGLLDTFQSSNQQVRVILEFNDAGSWIPDLLAPTGAKRMVVASTTPGRENIMESGLSFTDFLMNEILDGKSLSDSVLSARRAIRRTSNNVRQLALIDDNGNGIANEKNQDGQAVRGEFIGAAFVTGEDIPFIASVTPFTIVTNNSVLLYAAGVTDADGISNLVCNISSPTNHLGALSTPVALTNNPVTMRWELDYHGLDRAGIYQLAFQAMDNTGRLSPIVQSTVQRLEDGQTLPGGGAGPDEFEPDDSSAIATAVDVPISQLHTLHQASDGDWISFFATSNLLFDIETVHLATNLDTVIELYYQTTNAQLQLVERVDQFGYELGELAGLTFPQQGRYFVKISAANDTVFNPGAYQLIVHVPAGLSGIHVYVYDVSTGEVMPGVTVRASGLGNRNTDSSGVARFEQAGPGNYSVEALSPENGYQALFGYVSPTEVPGNANSSYGNPRNLRSSEFQELGFGGGSFTYLVFGFVPTARLTGNVRGLFGDALSGAELRLRRSSDLASFVSFPWSFGSAWITDGGGGMPGSIHLPPNENFILYVVADQLGYEVYVHPVTVTLGGLGSVTDLGPIQLLSAFSDNPLPDPWEIANGLDPAGDTTLDVDLDGLNAEDEYTAGTSPNDGDDRFEIPEMGENALGELCISVTGMPHRVYTLEQNSDLRTPQWVPVGSSITNSVDRAALKFVLPEVTGPAVFRVRVKLEE